MRLGKLQPERLEAACQRALTLGACSYKSLESILKHGLDRQPLPQQPEGTASPHPNIRGPQYYNEERGEPSCSRSPPRQTADPAPPGMYHALVEQLQMPDIAALTFEERFGLLVDREITERENRRLTTRLRQAKRRRTACIEDIDYRHPRGLDKALMARLTTCQWVREHHNVLITGPTGIGKTWLGCALGHQACRDGLTALYLRLPRFLQELPMAKGDGRYGNC